MSCDGESESLLVLLYGSPTQLEVARMFLSASRIICDYAQSDSVFMNSHKLMYEVWIAIYPNELEHIDWGRLLSSEVAFDHLQFDNLKGTTLCWKALLSRFLLPLCFYIPFRLVVS